MEMPTDAMIACSNTDGRTRREASHSATAAGTRARVRLGDGEEELAGPTPSAGWHSPHRRGPTPKRHAVGVSFGRQCMQVVHKIWGCGLLRLTWKRQKKKKDTTVPTERKDSESRAPGELKAAERCSAAPHAQPQGPGTSARSALEG
jgi:hypothetical protein